MTTAKKIAASAMLSGGLAVSLYVTAGVANADGCSNHGPQPDPPCHWCPGQPPPMTGNHVTDPLRWDFNVCHTYWFVWPGQGNVSNLIFDGVAPPPPPPPSDPGPFVIDRSNCQQILGMFCPKA
jgi:hypothetical protein